MRRPLDHRPRELTVPARRFTSPFGAQRAKLEPITQPLYSAWVVNNGAVPALLPFFQYAIGENVPVNFGTFIPLATSLYTNLQVGGQLPTPKVHLVTGLRVAVAEMSRSTGGGPAALPTATTAANVTGPTYTGQDLADLDDLQRILWGSSLKFDVGNKNYLTLPTAFLPGNVGAQGSAALLSTGGMTPTAPVTLQRAMSFVSRGDYFSLTPYNVLIASQQNFNATLNFEQNAAERPQMTSARVIYVLLDGILGREVQ